jgi:hypothetical protein
MPFQKLRPGQGWSDLGKGVSEGGGIVLLKVLATSNTWDLLGGESLTFAQ